MDKFPKEKWCTAPRDGVGLTALAAPYDNIWIGSDPRDGMTPETANSFDAIINVSDTPCALFYPARPDQRTYWIPLNEMGYWGYAAYFAFAHIMDFHYAKGHKIITHCHAGAYRSPYMTMSWLISRGHTPEEAIAIYENNPKYMEKYRQESHFQWRLKRLTSDPDNTPARLKEFYERLRNSQYDTECLQSLLHYPKNLELTGEIVGNERVRRYRRERWLVWYRWLQRRKLKTKEFFETIFGNWYVVRITDWGTYRFKRKKFWSWPYFDARKMNEAEKDALIDQLRDESLIRK